MLSQNTIITDNSDQVRSDVNYDQCEISLHDPLCKSCYYSRYQERIAPFGFEYIQANPIKSDHCHCCNLNKKASVEKSQQQLSEVISIVQLNLFMEVNTNELC